MTRRWWSIAERRGSIGSITPFVLISMLALIPLAGLVIDGGRQLNGRARAIAYAQEAARAGAQALDLRVDETRLVPGLAEQLVRQYCTEAINGNGEIAGDSTLVRCEPVLVRDSDNAGEFLTIGVETTVEVDPLLLDMFGVPTMRATGRAVARAFTGITEVDEGIVPTVPPPLGETQPPGNSGLPTVGPGEQDPLAPGTVPTCVPGDQDDDPDPAPSTPSAPPPTDPSGTPPTTPPTTTPTEPPGNNDLEQDNGPRCPDGDDEPEGGDEQPGDEDAGGDEPGEEAP